MSIAVTALTPDEQKAFKALAKQYGGEIKAARSVFRAGLSALAIHAPTIAAPPPPPGPDQDVLLANDSPAGFGA